MSKSKAELSKELEAAVAEFLANGGEIQVVPPASEKREPSKVGSVWNSGRKAVTLGKA
jgi:hypothetical protein